MTASTDLLWPTVGKCLLADGYFREAVSQFYLLVCAVIDMTFMLYSKPNCRWFTYVLKEKNCTFEVYKTAECIHIWLLHPLSVLIGLKGVFS